MSTTTVTALRDSLIELANARARMRNGFEPADIRPVECLEDAIGNGARKYADEISDLLEVRQLLIGGLAFYSKTVKRGELARSTLERAGINAEEIEAAQAYLMEVSR